MHVTHTHTQCKRNRNEHKIEHACATKLVFLMAIALVHTYDNIRIDNSVDMH